MVRDWQGVLAILLRYTFKMIKFINEEVRILKRLSSPKKIQAFFDAQPINFEKRGDTYMSPRRALREKKMHCFEGALVAALALYFHGERPLILDLKAKRPDFDHVVALYKRNGYWGALSKTNHAVLRSRDPIYKTIRELALSYFHEYYSEKTGRKNMVSYSRPLDLRRFGTTWITAEHDLWEVADALDALPHYPCVPKKNKELVIPASRFERKTTAVHEWHRSDQRT